MHAGIDYDTKAVHVVLLPEEGHAEYLAYELEGGDPFDRARQVREVMPPRAWWKDEGVISACIEEQNSGNPKMRYSVQQLKMIQGAILSCLPRDLLVAPFAGSEWRTKLGLAGNCSKDEVRAFVDAQRLGDRALVNKGSCQEPLWEPSEFEDWPQDACDAYCLAMCAEKLTEPMAA